MARTFRRQRQLHPVAELNITNLVDLGFTLLIIFMIATPLMQNEQKIPLDLPVEASRPQNSEKEEIVTISIDQSGRYYWNNGSSAMSLTDIRTQLQAVATKTKPPVVRIRADFRLQYQAVVTVLDEIKAQNLSRIALDTQVSK